MSERGGWLGVDLDGTLAHYDEWVAYDVIGEPIPAMVERVRAWIAEGREVRIFTARVDASYGKILECRKTGRTYSREDVERAIRRWLADRCSLPPLAVTCVKDYAMIELWDDRCVQVVPNTGRTLAEEHEAERSALAGKP